MAGGFLILFGIFKLGALIKFIPFPVVTGFTSGIAVVIFATQLKDIFGLKVEMPESFFGKLQTIITHTDKINYTSFALCAGTVAVIVICQKLFPKLPAMLIGMLTATAVSVIFGLGVETIGDRFGDLPSGLPMPQMPQIEWANLHKLISPAMTIALLAAIESLLSATVADGMTGGPRHRPNTELIAQGIGNIGSALFGGIPATGAIARTAANIKNGGRTPIAGMVHAVVLLLVLLVLMPYASLIPMPTIAAILFVVAYNMSEWRKVVSTCKTKKWAEIFVMLLTLILTVVFDLVVAIVVGMLFVGLFALINKFSKKAK
jgi:SulP family sulfate permease